MLTRLDITNPHGQKFAPGDLVKLITPSHGHPAGTTFRVIGSNIQVCGSALLFNVYDFDYQPPDKDTYEYHSLFKTYSLVRIETGYSSSWYDEQRLEALPTADTPLTPEPPSQEKRKLSPDEGFAKVVRAVLPGFPAYVQREECPDCGRLLACSKHRAIPRPNFED